MIKPALSVNCNFISKAHSGVVRNRTWRTSLGLNVTVTEELLVSCLLKQMGLCHIKPLQLRSLSTCVHWWSSMADTRGWWECSQLAE